MHSTNNFQLAYLFLKIALGISMFGHGLVRIPKIAAFRTWMVGEFKDSILPDAITYGFATILPFFEFIIGLLLLLGLFTRQAIIAGAILIMMLMFGSCLIENWQAVGSQMIYILFFSLLMMFIQHNKYSLDLHFFNK